MQSYYSSNHHQLQAAAVAAAAAAAAGAGGQQRFPFQAPFTGLRDHPGGSPHLRGLHATSENSLSICGPTQQPTGCLDEVNESEMDSDILSENDDDDDDDVNDSERLESLNLSKLKRKVNDEREEEEEEEEEEDIEKTLKTHRHHHHHHHNHHHHHLSSSTHKRLREGLNENGCYRTMDGEGDPGSGPGLGPGPGVDDDDHAMQTEIKVQRPLGLLAQHGLTTKAATAAAMTKTHGSSQSLQAEHGGGGGGGGDDGGGWEKDQKLQDEEADQDGRHHRQETEERDKGGGGGGGGGLGLGLDFSSSSHHSMSLMDRRFMPSPPPLSSPTGLDPNKPPSTPSGHHWTFEEQFKQLYEMSPESKRKEFLDDLFTFMQKRGTPVNRIPIMAKQTLDLYELFRLVVSKGGLVEVINKKLWREITKGLNLPSSITSAAFTLRTQYMKYLYPYECDKLKLSTLAELQSAIDGNRREGRRPGYGYDFSPIPTMLHTPPTPHLNGPMHPLAAARPPTGLSPKDEERSLLQSGHLRSLAEHDVRAMEMATRAMEDLVNKRMEEVSRAAIAASGVMTSNCVGGGVGGVMSAASIINNSSANKFDEMPPLKRPTTMFDDDRFLAQVQGMHSTHIKLNSRSNGRLEYDSSMVVSMEINGLMYQGVLFAQHPRRI